MRRRRASEGQQADFLARWYPSLHMEYLLRQERVRWHRRPRMTPQPGGSRSLEARVLNPNATMDWAQTLYNAVPIAAKRIHTRLRRPQGRAPHHRIDKVPQQANFWFSKTRGLPRSPFQQRAVRPGKRQGSPQHAIHLEYWLGRVAHEGMPATDSKTWR